MGRPFDWNGVGLLPRLGGWTRNPLESLPVLWFYDSKWVTHVNSCLLFAKHIVPSSEKLIWFFKCYNSILKSDYYRHLYWRNTLAFWSLVVLFSPVETVKQLLKQLVGFTFNSETICRKKKSPCQIICKPKLCQEVSQVLLRMLRNLIMVGKIKCQLEDYIYGHHWKSDFSILCTNSLR